MVECLPDMFKAVGFDPEHGGGGGAGKQLS